MNKSKEQLSSVLVDFERLFREVQTNRCNPQLLEKYINPEGKGIIQQTRRILDGTDPEGSFPQAEAALGAFQATLNNKQPPQPPEVQQARTQLSNLRAVLVRLRGLLEIQKGRTEVLRDLNVIIELEKQQAKNVELLTKAELDRLKSPLITSNKPIEVKVGQTVTVKHAIDWKLYAQGQLVIAIDTPKDSDLKVPLDITLKDDKNDFGYEVTAGAKVGSYTLKLKPFVGNTVEQQINVTK